MLKVPSAYCVKYKVRYVRYSALDNVYTTVAKHNVE